MNQGWIRLHRKIKHSPIWHDPHYLKLWMYCLLEASHKEREVFFGLDSVQIKTGQFVTGRIKLADEMNEGMKDSKSGATWWRHLKKLEKLGMIEVESTNKYSIVTICNWEQYQKDEEQEQPKAEEVKPKKEPVEVPDFPNDLADEDDYGLVDNKLAKVMEFYQANRFGAINDFIYTKISDWCNDLNHELVIEAMKIAIVNNALRWNYVESILKSWLNNKITTIDQVKAEQAKRQAEKQQRQPRGYGRRPIRQEMVPEYINSKKSSDPHEGMTPEEIKEFEEMKREAERIQARYKKGS